MSVLGASIAAIGLVLLVSCGGGGGSKTAKASGSTTSTTADAAARRAAIQAFRDCMSQHGVTLPDFGNRGPGGTGGANQAQGQGTATTVAGATPPTGGGGPGGGGPGGGGNRFLRNLPPGVTMEQAQAALQACQSKLPTGGQNNSAFRAYRRCLSDHGVQVPDFTGNGPRPTINFQDPKLAEADRICRPLLPNNGQGGQGPQDSAATSTTLAQ